MSEDTEGHHPEVLRSRRVSSADMSTIHVVVLLHGIRTRAFWYDVARPILSGIDNVVVKPLGYGYFNIFQFLLPFAARRGPQRTILEKLRELKWDYEQKGQTIRLSVIAHSFGTYTIASILSKEKNLDLYNLVLCGSVVPMNFDFANIKRQVKNICVNDVGARDIFPVLAKISSFGYGESGTFGFYSPLCDDRFHDCGHSSFFTKKFIADFWYPIFSEGKLIQSQFVRSIDTRSRIISFVASLPRAAIPLILILTALYFAWVGGVGKAIGLPCAYISILPFCTQSSVDCADSEDFVRCKEEERSR